MQLKKNFDHIISNSHNKTKTIWNIVKTTTNKHNTPNVIPSISINNHSTNDLKTIANAFNSYFTSIADNLISKTICNSISTPTDPLTYLHGNMVKPNSDFKIGYTSNHEIMKTIHSLNNTNSHGYDEISLKILQISAPFISSPLTCVCNKIFSSGTFPTRLKFAEVKPLFKKGSKCDLTNYRPISLLSKFSKIIEKIIYHKLYKYLDTHNILAKEQFGFRKGLSTDTATYTLLNSALTSLQNNKLVGALCCDLEKAFDCVNHDILSA